MFPVILPIDVASLTCGSESRLDPCVNDPTVVDSTSGDLNSITLRLQKQGSHIVSCYNIRISLTQCQKNVAKQKVKGYRLTVLCEQLTSKAGVIFTSMGQPTAPLETL
jgi:hypothetical protein